MTTELEKIDGLARLLIEARTNRVPLATVPDDLVPADAGAAQLVDDHVAAVTGWPVLGWKIGCTSEHAQKLLGSSGPFAGRVYSVYEDGAVITDDDLCTDPMLEGEFAFTIADDLTPSAPPTGGRTRAGVMAAVADLRPAIELVGGRYATFVGTPLLLLVADAGANTHLVLGSPVTDPDLEALDAVGVTMEVDGANTGRGRGADVLGHPIDALMWLVDHLSARSITLRAGQVVTTGTATQVSAFPAGATATASFAGLGSVSVGRG
ncbi:MAG: 2-keto-4-pentenoate hydratase [Acidimicrobiales bacterium]